MVARVCVREKERGREVKYCVLLFCKRYPVIKMKHIKFLLD